MTSVRFLRAEQVRVAGLDPQVVGDRHAVADRGGAGHHAGLGLEHREQAAFRGQPGDLDRVRRGTAPAERAGHQDVQVAGAVEVHRPGGLVLQVAQVGHGGGGHVGDLVRHRDQRGVLALAEPVARLGPDSLGGGGARGRRGGSGALHAGVHVRLVVVADVLHVVVALEHPGQAGHADVDRTAVTALADHPDVGAPCGLQGRGDPGGDRRRVPEQRVQPGDLPGRFGERGGEDLQAAGRVDRDHLAAGGAHHRVQGVAGAERLAAALAGAVPAGERVGALGARLDAALIWEQPVPDRETAGLVELDSLVRHGPNRSVRR